ncbi:MAG TPA: bifunctional [glutamine synthetase] adenylyltransferase/[glutamine synthetase]-adenylyl-L-tyrosine phosphorylase [Dongiaceae bacterium]|jgi:glutamate-ammonia-ligase adenylyltransferase|nr:bifunctional [glutamine synthetase] adenylyltransferase/[glutamine synthetase]-adenylyl-L-tyrosine phosphorylase [Dongiaceae bacterium]
MPTFLSLLADRPLPLPGDPRRAEMMLAQAKDTVLAEVMADPAGNRLLESVFGNSPFLARSLMREPEFGRLLAASDPESLFSTLIAELHPKALIPLDEAAFMQALRVARRRAALVIALADIAGLWPLEQSTGALSRFADAAVQATVAYLLAAARGELELADPDDPARDSGFFVLALGKLGALELNYSSDIDLMLLYDQAKVRYAGRRSAQECFVRLARNLVRLMQDATPDGYVCRVDLRLRPDPGSTPLVMSALAAETYYEGMGQNWERAAMIKARVCAGDEEAGRQFLNQLRPFVWRKHLDFYAIQDIHSIKRQIHAVKGHRFLAVAGHNIKVGRGGIREIEFFVQTQQLIWGGRNPALRKRATLDALEALVAFGRTKRQVADDLAAAYRYLRHVEHRLQMIEDHQTQTLPEMGPALHELAKFCGHRDVHEFEITLLEHMAKVEDHYAELFEEAQDLGGPSNLVFTGTEDDPGTVASLEAMGFPDGSTVAGFVRDWHRGRYRATRSARARELLTELMPRLLKALAETADPDHAIRRFDAFLHALPAGVQILSLFYSNPGLLDLVAEIMGSAPLLADALSRRAVLLENVLSAGFFDPVPQRIALDEDLGRQLEQAGDFEDSLDIVRRWTKDRQFQIGVRLLRGTADGEEAGLALSDIADIALARLFPLTAAEFARQHGRLPGRGMVPVALGKLGSREMTITSDLDLIFIYDIPEDVEHWDTLLSDGMKPLAPIQYFARLAQRFINSISAMTGEGGLFEVDMRLRPSGASGPIASGLQPFEKYQGTEAWTWEHMALTRARVICGDAGLRSDFEAAVKRTLTAPRDPAKLAADIIDMRLRMAQQHRTDNIWDLKHLRGGQVDLDFIAQYLQLRHGHDHPDILDRQGWRVLDRSRDIGLIADDMAEQLIAIGRLWRQLQQMIRLLVGGKVDEASLREPTRRHLAQSAGADSFEDLKGLIRKRAAFVHAAYRQIIGPEPAP